MAYWKALRARVKELERLEEMSHAMDMPGVAIEQKDGSWALGERVGMTFDEVKAIYANSPAPLIIVHRYRGANKTTDNEKQAANAAERTNS